MDPKQILNKVKSFFQGLPSKLKVLTLGEKIAIGMIGLGLLMILIAIILF